VNREDVFSLIKWNIYLLIVNGAVLMIVALISGQSVIGYYSTLLLIETAVALLLGSVLEMSGSLFFGKIREHVFHSEKKWSLKSYDEERRKATPYIFLGFLLLSEALLVSFVFG
jgi:hypothetical protein